MKKILTLFTLLFFTSISAFSQLNMSFYSNYKFANGVGLANLWGYTDADGREYALVGTTNGMHIIEVTDPSNPVFIDSVPGPASIWREVRTWQHYAYVTTEGGGGLVIVDLSTLPNPVTFKAWKGNNAIDGILNTIHALHIDEGYIYLYGSNLFSGAAIIADLNDPWNPNYISRTFTTYVHDGYVRDDVMYPAHINSGYFSVIDVSDKANPLVLQTQNTPNNFTHNTWLSDDSRVLFTTDEKDNSFLASYDITNLDNIRELGRVQSNPGSNSMVHNTHVLNDYAVTSWYKDGVVIVDGHKPDNLVIVGSYDTSPLSGGGSNGCWGVYPYFPSGNIIASDMEEGLFVLSADYNRACYLEGIVSDSVCGNMLGNVLVTISANAGSVRTNFSGEYKTGAANPGTYSVTFTSPGYDPLTINDVVLERGEVTRLEVKLFSPTIVSASGNVKTTGGENVAGALVSFESNVNSYNLSTDEYGNFERCIIPLTYEGIAGKWGYETDCRFINSADFNESLNFELKQNYYDDFTFNFGWTVSGDATAGNWERGRPVGTTFNGIISNPFNDVNGDCSNKAFITGNGGGFAGDDDVDDGRTVLTSPSFNLTTYTDPVISYYRWFFNAGGNSTPNDSLIVRLHNGSETVVVEVVTAQSAGNSSWQKRTFRVKDYITPTSSMRISFDAIDANPGHLVEAGVDVFHVTENPSAGIETVKNENRLSVYPNPNHGSTPKVEYQLTEEIQQDAKIIVYNITGASIFEKKIASSEGIEKLDFTPAPGIYFVKLINGRAYTPAVKMVITE
jgi:choice-of-anchor B domain-containing protein